MDKLIRRAAEQATRFIEKLETDGQVELFDKQKRQLCVVKRADYRLIVPLSITVDNLEPVSARVADFIGVDGKARSAKIWSISHDILRVFRDVFPLPTVLCHYVEQRLKAIGHKELGVWDEIDHIGLYFSHNMYVEHAADYSSPVTWFGYSEDIDRYYLSGAYREGKPPPRQELPSPLWDLIELLDSSLERHSALAVSMILNSNSAGRQILAEFLTVSLGKVSSTLRPRIVTVFGKPETTTVWVRSSSGNADRQTGVDQAMAELLRQDIESKMFIDLTVDSNGTMLSAHPQLLLKSTLSSVDRRRLLVLSEEQVVRRLSRVKAKIGRNDVCPCGSGRKFKRCCFQRVRHTSI